MLNTEPDGILEDRMNHASRRGRAVRLRPGLMGLLAVALVVTSLPVASRAQSLVVSTFAGRQRRAANRVRGAVVKALSDQGAKLVSYKQYLRTARRMRIPGKRALRPRAIRRVAGKMGVDGVVSGAVTRRGRRFVVVVRLFGANGRVLAKKAYRLRRPGLPPKVAGQLASLMVTKLGGTAVAEAPPEPPPEPTPPPEPPPTEGEGETGAGGGGGSGDAFLPPWARTDKKETSDTTTTAAATTGGGGGETSGEVTEPAPRRRRRTKTGAVPDILLAAGASLNARAGLNPRHESGVFPGVRVDGRFFLGSFLDTVVVRDIGFAGYFNMGLGLQYGPENSDDKWDSSQMQWQGELVYRLALNDIPLQPAFMLRVGYGSTTATIDTENQLAVSAGYSYPYGALDIYLMLYKPYLRLHMSGGYLFTVMTSEDLSGSGSGFTVRGGIDVDLFDNLHIGVGYDMWQFLGVKIGDSEDETSDIFHSFYARVGWNFK